jgi:hypothetical protein
MNRRKFLGLLPLATVGGFLPFATKIKEKAVEVGSWVKVRLRHPSHKHLAERTKFHNLETARAAQQEIFNEASQVMELLRKHKKIELVKDESENT